MFCCLLFCLHKRTSSSAMFVASLACLKLHKYRYAAREQRKLLVSHTNLQYIGFQERLSCFLFSFRPYKVREKRVCLSVLLWEYIYIIARLALAPSLCSSSDRLGRFYEVHSFTAMLHSFLLASKSRDLRVMFFDVSK